MTLENLLEDYGNSVAGEPFTIDKNGVCELAFYDDQRMVIEPVPGSNRVHLHADLGRLPDQESIQLYRSLLDANRFGLGTNEATLALDNDLDKVLLCYWFDEQKIDQYEFDLLMVNFMETADDWTRKISEHISADPQESSGEQSTQASMGPSFLRP